MMKAMGSGKRGPMAGIAQAMGFGGGMKPPSPEEMKALAEKMQGGAGGGMPTLPKDLPAGLRPGLPNLPGLTGLSGKPTLPGLGGFPDWGRRNEEFVERSGSSMLILALDRGIPITPNKPHFKEN